MRRITQMPGAAPAGGKEFPFRGIADGLAACMGISIANAHMAGGRA